MKSQYKNALLGALVASLVSGGAALADDTAHKTDEAAPAAKNDKAACKGIKHKRKHGAAGGKNSCDGKGKDGCGGPNGCSGKKSEEEKPAPAAH